jgi:hypothetical protein
VEQQITAFLQATQSITKPKPDTQQEIVTLKAKSETKTKTEPTKQKPPFPKIEETKNRGELLAKLRDPKSELSPQMQLARVYMLLLEKDFDGVISSTSEYAVVFSPSTLFIYCC